MEWHAYKTPFAVKNREDKNTCSVISFVDPAWDLRSASFNVKVIYIYIRPFPLSFNLQCLKKARKNPQY